MAVQPGLCGTRPKALKTGFLTTRLILCIPGNDGLPLAGIIGIAVGGLLLLVVSCLLLIYCIKQKQKEKVHIVKELQI